MSGPSQVTGLSPAARLTEALARGAEVREAARQAAAAHYAASATPPPQVPPGLVTSGAGPVAAVVTGPAAKSGGTT
jgi:hypothetical protein